MLGTRFGYAPGNWDRVQVAPPSVNVWSPFIGIHGRPSLNLRIGSRDVGISILGVGKFFDSRGPWSPPMKEERDIPIGYGIRAANCAGGNHLRIYLSI